MNIFIAAIGVLQLLLVGVESFGFKGNDDYVHRNVCMYGFSTVSDQPYDFQGKQKVLNNTALLYFQLDGDNDTVRYVWSLVGTPTLFMSVQSATDEERRSCSDSVKKLFNHNTTWKTFVNNQSNGSIDIPHDEFAFSAVFNSLIEFEDTKYKANKAFNGCDVANNSKLYHRMNLTDLDWTFNYDNMELVAVDERAADDEKKFKWTVQISVPNKPGRMKGFPKTLYTVNSTYFDFVFSNFNYSTNLDDEDNGRLVLEMQLVYGGLTPGQLQEKFSRDDEYTPSVFITYNQLFDDDYSQGYLQWKPISYLSSKRKSTQSQQALSNDKCKPDIILEDLNPGLVPALYKDSIDAGEIVPLYIVFGTEGDDNNPCPSYVSWTGLIGFGIPPEDSISFVVILTICIGLGVPALLIGLGGVFLVIRRKPWKRLTGSATVEGKGYKKLDINDNSEEK